MWRCKTCNRIDYSDTFICICASVYEITVTYYSMGYAPLYLEFEPEYTAAILCYRKSSETT